MRIDPEKFWMQAERWPLDVERYVFLGRAVEQIAVAQLEPLEALTHPLSERMRKSVDLARDRIAKEAAAGRLKTAYLQGATFRRLAPIEWATIDRDALFSSLFLFPGTIYGPGIFAESEGPMYVEAASLTEYLKFTVTMARAAEADYTLGRVSAERYSIKNPPDILPPPGFMSINSALDALTGETPQEKLLALRNILAAGRAEAILQFCETGKLEGIAADYWLSDEALEALSDNGVASVPEDPHNPKSFCLMAYFRVRPTPQPESGAGDDTPKSEQNAPADEIAAPPRKELKVSRRTFNLYEALRGHYGPLGGVDSHDNAPTRAAAAAAWANRQNPRPSLPADAARYVHRIDELTEAFTKSLKPK